MDILVLIGLGILYFLPTIVANTTKNINTSAIFVVNLFLGWTLIGWVISLAWSLKK